VSLVQKKWYYDQNTLSGGLIFFIKKFFMILIAKYSLRPKPVCTFGDKRLNLRASATINNATTPSERSTSKLYTHI
jgi:hypothetical protein